MRAWKKFKFYFSFKLPRMFDRCTAIAAKRAEYLRRAGGEAHSHVGKRNLINGTQFSYIISPPCVNTLLAVRAGLLKQIFQYETKSKIQMEW